MQVGLKDLTVWSFLMASAHGAGLMVLPLVIGGIAMPHCLMHASHTGPWSIAWATALHSAGYLVVSALVAWIVFEKLGVDNPVALAHLAHSHGLVDDRTRSLGD